MMHVRVMSREVPTPKETLDSLSRAELIALVQEREGRLQQSRRIAARHGKELAALRFHQSKEPELLDYETKFVEQANSVAYLRQAIAHVQAKENQDINNAHTRMSALEKKIANEAASMRDAYRALRDAFTEQFGHVETRLERLEAGAEREDGEGEFLSEES